VSDPSDISELTALVTLARFAALRLDAPRGSCGRAWPDEPRCSLLRPPREPAMTPLDARGSTRDSRSTTMSGRVDDTNKQREWLQSSQLQ
jgi:hypothetical protein